MSLIFMVPDCTTFALIPRKFNFFPRPELTKTMASTPNLAANFLQTRVWWRSDFEDGGTKGQTCSDWQIFIAQIQVCV